MKARDLSFELAMFGAWQGERFAREERLQSFGHYAKALRRQRRQSAQDKLMVFRELAAAGAPLKITKLK